MFRGFVSPSRACPFDVETGDSLLEVKTCKVETKGCKYKGKQYVQEGRFVVSARGHERLKAKAKELRKRGEYAFLLLSKEDPLKIVAMKLMPLLDVEPLLERGTRYIRKHGSTRLIMLRYSLIFDGREQS